MPFAETINADCYAVTGFKRPQASRPPRRAGNLRHRADHPIIRVDLDDDGGIVGRHLGDIGEGRDDDEVADLDVMGRRAIGAEDAAAGRRRDSISGQPRAVGDVPDMDFLVGDNVGGQHQRLVDRKAAFVMQVGVGHRATVNLAFEHATVH